MPRAQYKLRWVLVITFFSLLLFVRSFFVSRWWLFCCVYITQSQCVFISVSYPLEKGHSILALFHFTLYYVSDTSWTNKTLILSCKCLCVYWKLVFSLGISIAVYVYNILAWMASDNDDYNSTLLAFYV